MHRLVSSDGPIAKEIKACPEFELLAGDPNILAWFLVEELNGDGPKRSPATSGRTSDALTEPVSLEMNTTGLLDESGVSRAKEWARHLALPLSVAEMRELTRLRQRAFGDVGRSGVFGFEREAVFRAVGDLEGPSHRRSLLEASMWNPWWPDGELRLDFSPLMPTVIFNLSDSWRPTAFQRGDQTILHCMEMTPPVGTGPLDWHELVAVLVCKEFFLGPPDPESFWIPVSVFDREARAASSSLLAASSEPAVGRFEPQLRIGGDMTPAIPSNRLIELVGAEGFERVCWCDGRRPDTWGPGPVLSRGTALLCRSDLLLRLTQHELAWAILHNGIPTHFIHQRRGLIFRRAEDDRGDA